MSEATEDEKSVAAADAGPSLLIAIAIALVLGGAAGGGFGFAVLPGIQVKTEPPPVKAPEPETLLPLEKTFELKYPADAVEIPVAPIVTSIGAEKKTHVRMEFSLVAVKGTKPEIPVKNEIREDVIAYLWGLELKQIEGGRGFERLRAELQERARLRGNGVIIGLLIGSLVVR